ncbi:MotA/TolQ/ExbB proton channel family protein [Wenzhouxiangella marina]|uniref:Biopolymer transport protein ExbB n=1 Tax=Wenzhouxiangella marina TaxID=1579979 RepID=A0A0K0XT13_9GAMM|nr:MotA/TolQ/ExbB proton channel family protein [Wenzhouxiangella marina]AKS40854.1 Biopolymer transport protein ExbB [Wenzhouxiangella marina]MBB6087728.1 biopolymer transport protein ExbB [Wenzhouxiangella marina]
MKSKILLFVAALVVAPLGAQAQDSQTQTLEDLLRVVEQAASEEARVDQDRLQRFIRERANQRQLLDEARAELARQEARAERLRNAFDQNEIALVELETTLDERMGNLGELFGVVRQVAGDVASSIEESMVSAQLPGRAEYLSELAQRRELPTANELSRMWLEMVREIYQSGRVVKFTAPVVNSDGQLEDGREVVRVGVFNVVSDGKFLTWNGEELAEMPRQPAPRFQSMAQALQDAAPGSVEEMAIDGTRGAILASVVRSPTWEERRRQGGPVGNVIIALGIFGVLFSLWKGIVLFMRGSAIKRQLKREEASDNNALGRVMKVYQDDPDQDVETLELKLDEAILRETAPLESGLPLIKVLYVIAPLVGLLGTVVGMIVTFQQITLFGTGDPRMMANGISMALITTVLGLVVAIPLTIIHSLLHSRARALIQILEEQSAGIIARLAEHRHGRSQ